MSDTPTPMTTARRAARAAGPSPRASAPVASRAKPGRTRRIRRAPESAVAAILAEARDRRLEGEADRLGRFAQEFGALCEALRQLLARAEAARLDAEAERLERAIGEEEARREWVSSLRRARGRAA